MILSVYNRYLKNIDLHAGKYKAEDWVNFLHHYSLPLFKNNISDDTFMMWNEFTMRVFLATKMKITLSDIDDAEIVFATFLNCYYEKVYRWKRDRLSACTYTIHALSHVAQCMRWWRPLSIIWQFASERYCGLVKSRAKVKYIQLQIYLRFLRFRQLCRSYLEWSTQELLCRIGANRKIASMGWHILHETYGSYVQEEYMTWRMR